MKCEFSETQYAFGVLREITQILNPSKGWFSPIIPTQADEHDLGYDCKLEGSVRSLFFQFKIPRKLTRTSSKYWSDFGGVYFEFKIWPDSLTHQHNKLVDLAKKSSRNAVFYCSPAFIKQEEFYEFYCSNTISANSIMVNCDSLSRITGSDKHVITYRLNPAEYYMHSDEGIRYNGLRYDQFISALNDTESYASLEQCVNTLYREFNMAYDENKNVQERLSAVAYELLIKYDTFLVLF